MKCPKCGFLGFDSGDRCKNCGYDFSLIEGSRDPARHAAPPVPPSSGRLTRDPRLVRRPRYRLDSGTPGGVGVDRPLAGQPEGTPVDLPLFGGDDPAPPPARPPLAVRRPTPSRIRPRSLDSQSEPLPLDMEEPPAAAPLTDLAGGEDDAESPGAYMDEAQPMAEVPPVAPGFESSYDVPPAWDFAPAGRRAIAAAIDFGLLLIVDLVVLHFTLTLCGLTVNEVGVLPPVPMVAFLLLLNGGYIVLFTGTLGQTVGKMATSIEVVPDPEGRMDVRRALMRGAAMVVSVLPAGLGWLPGLVGDHRSLHDRLAGTRVVRVAAP